ncbi:thymidylate synthase [Bacillus smithii]|uniref:thymidylate synthase n=1 Tax=Bacillus smithii TaxID=1479 RepID=UPI002E1B7191|nr:thymidylate synthase [Bacillus smithii]MED4928858.1 thymidylate synthase [Bacillus smithii]
MSNFDLQYRELVKEILENGYYAENRTADKTKKVFGKVINVDLQKEFPILTLKYTPFKTLVNEMRWIYQIQSNDVRWLQERNIHIWDEWMKSDYTIGSAYGYQVKKHKQMDKLLHDLKHNNQSRRMMINLWQCEDLKDMSLTPCMFNSIWDVNDGYLNTHVTIRSSDVALGLPFNIAQMAVLNHLLAHVSGLKPGKMIFVLTNAHLYEQHFEPIQEIFKREPYSAPKLWINKDIQDFYQFTDEDIKLIDYKYHPHIKMRVSV